MNNDDSLIQAMPDWLAFVRRDGTVQRQLGGRRLCLPDVAANTGESLANAWSAEIAADLLPLIQRTLKDRKPAEAPFIFLGRQYRARVLAHGRERALCVIQAMTSGPDSERRADAGAAGRGSMERRAFADRLKQLVANASLREAPLAIFMIHIDGLDAMGQLFDFSLVDQAHTALLTRLPSPEPEASGCCWNVGRLGDNILAAVVERCAERESLRELAMRFQESLSLPVAVGSANFELTPSLGIAILGADASRSRALLECAHSAMIEARRNEQHSIAFYSDTLRIRSLARLDMERELREAITTDGLALRYVGRYELGSAELVAIHSYLTWPHPLRGEVRAAEFLPIAAATGLATSLSRWALQRLRRDLPALRALRPERLKLSFGALRHHFAANALSSEVQAWIESGEIAPSELELRISEKALSNLGSPAATLRALAHSGVSICVDEFGCGVTSLAKLARFPIAALQLDRALVQAVHDDAASLKAVRAAISIAAALDLRSIAAGIDTQSQHDILSRLGCLEGLGDCFSTLHLAAPQVGHASSNKGFPCR